MQRAQDMIVGAAIVGVLIGTVAGGALWVINDDLDGNGAAFFGVVIALIAFVVLYLGWAREPQGGPAGVHDVSPSAEDMPGAPNAASRLAVREDGAAAPVATPEPAAAAPAAAPAAAAATAPAPEAEVKSSQLAGETELSERKGAWTYTADAAEAAPSADDRPAGLEAAREGGADDLKLIKGVGPKLEKLVNSMGFYHFDQIASWSSKEIAWVDENLEGFKGRVTRDEWVAQAKILASGGETEFSKRNG